MGEERKQRAGERRWVGAGDGGADARHGEEEARGEDVLFCILTLEKMIHFAD